VILERLQCACRTSVNRLQSSIVDQLLSDCRVIAERLQGKCITIAESIVKVLQDDCRTIVERLQSALGALRACFNDYRAIALVVA
jgi:hypothetical protein